MGVKRALKSLAPFDSFIAAITSGLGSAAAAGTTAFDGQTVAVYKAGDCSSAYFAATGPAYLLQISSPTGQDTGTLTFTWNQPTTVVAPPASQLYQG